MEKLKGKITIPNIIIAFIILQPIIDIITSLSIEYIGLSITFGMIIRTIFMIFVGILGIIKAKGKYKIAICVYFGALLLYMASFIANSYMQNGFALILTQAKGLIKNFYLPIIIVSLIPIFKSYEVKIDKKVFNTTLMIYVITIFICSIIGVAFPTYKAGDKAGTVGLFYSANEIGAILCLLSPFLVADLSNKKFSIKDTIFILLFVYAVLQLGTKVPYFGLIILIVSIIFACIINGKIKKEKYLYKKAGIFFACLVCIYLITGLTPVGKNLANIYGNIFPITEEMLKFGEQKPPTLTEFKDFEELKTTTVSGRDDFLKANKEKFTNSNLLNKLIGIGFIENENGNIKELKLTEMDYYDILFCSGIMGTTLFALPILIFAVMFIRYSMINKNKITIELIYSIVMAAVVALLAGHVLVSPAVSIYIAIILVKYDYEIRSEDEEKVENNDISTPPFRRRGRKNNCYIK